MFQRRTPRGMHSATRQPDPQDQRSVRLGLTRLGGLGLAKLSAQHLEELRRPACQLRPLWDGLEPST